MVSDIQVNMISAAKLHHMSTTDKIGLILDDVVKGRIVILEKGLDPREEAKLIEHTMIRIRDTPFFGIEMQSCDQDKKRSLWQMLHGENNRVTIIGPANRLKTLKKEKDIISTLIT